ncbi:MAG: helix-turn-helix domain-containing protein [Bacteroidales bacterium]|nr:helix-turn-helix domain-containing protein [Bacteroidales bacterium]
MNYYRNIWELESIPLPQDAVALGQSVLVINSVDMLRKINFPLRTESVVSIVGLQGELTLEVDLGEYTVRANSLMVLGPGHTIKGYRVSDNFRGFSIIATMKSMTRALPYLSRVVVCFIHFRENPVIQLTDEETDTQSRFHDLLQRKLTEPQTPYNGMVIKRLGEAILYETLGLYAAHMGDPMLASHRRGEELFYKFLTLVERHYKEERSVAFYADKMCVSAKHLSAVVKESSGRTAGDWIDSYVILEAKMMLSGSDLTVQQISTQLNFPNQSFFGKYFKHHTGYSPRQYRNDHHAE